MTSIFIDCQKCGDKVDVTCSKSPKQIKYCSTCKHQVRNERAVYYYQNRKLKCVCGANNNKHKIRCWKCGINLKKIISYTKPQTAFRQLEILNV